MKTVDNKQFIPFLMFIENYYHWCQKAGREPTFCKVTIADYLGINYRTLLRYFDYIDTTKNKGEGLITFVEQKRIRRKDGSWTQGKLSIYIVDCDRVLEKINQYVSYHPTEEERKAKFSDYFQHSHRACCTPEQIDIEDTEKEKKNKKKEKEAAIKAEKNKQYSEDYGFIVDMLDEVNNWRLTYPLRKVDPDHPEGLISTYLKDGKNRERNRLCGTPKPKKYKEGTLKSEMKRYQMIHRELGIDYDDIGESDENASIFRTEYFLNHGKLLPRYVDGKKLDLYEEIWKNCNFNKEFTKETRNQFKAIFMPLYMQDCANRVDMALVSCGYQYPNGIEYSGPF